MRVEQLGENVTLYLADCLEVLPTLGEGSVDSVITDPPYGVGYEGWDSDIPPQAILDHCLAIARGPVIMFGAAPRILDYAAYSPRPDRILIWSPAFTLSHTMAHKIAYRYHPIFLWRPRKVQGKGIWDVFRDNTECGNWWRHPATKPLSLMVKLTEAFADGTVLDPYMGSGTTGVACVKTGRGFVGVEIDESYFDIACHRIEAALRQPALKMGEPVPSKGEA